MIYFKKILFVSIFMSGFLLLVAPVAYAMTPTLTLSATGTSDNVQINVTGDPNVSVLLFSGFQSTVLGNTNSNGTFSNVVSSAAVLPNGISANTLVYVKTNGISGSQSANVSWPYTQSSSTNSSNITLNQTAVLLNIGQTSTITASASYIYLLSNTSPTVANINFNGNQITIQALTYGSTVANICFVGSTSNCASITVTVQNSSAQQLSFSQNNFSIISGQSIPVTVSGGSGTYTILNNSNSSSVQANLNGSVINLVGNSNGSAAITVCTTDMNNCGILNINSTTVNSTAVTFSQTNPVVPIGQSIAVTIYGGTGTNFYVSSNSNPSFVQANITNNILTLIGNISGTSTISICAYAGTCASLTANVSNVSSNGSISLSQNSVSILAGQSSSITILGGSTPYSISSSNSSNIFNGSVSGNILTIYGVNPGSTTANVCSSIGCTALSITVNSLTSSNNITLNQSNVSLNIGQQTVVYVSGGGNYYVANSSSPTVASAQISGNSITVTGMLSGSDNISICQNGGQCATLYVSVNGSTTSSLNQPILDQNNLSLIVGQNATVSISGGSSYYIASNSSSGVVSITVNQNSASVSAINIGTDTVSICQNGGGCANLLISVSQSSQAPIVTQPVVTSVPYVFLRYLGYGDKGSDVLELQNILANLGFLTVNPTGHYGPATVTAIKKFQSAHNIKQTGNVGPSTEGALNQLQVSVNSTTSQNGSLSKQQQMQQIQQEIQQLQSQLSAIQ